MGLDHIIKVFGWMRFVFVFEISRLKVNARASNPDHPLTYLRQSSIDSTLIAFNCGCAFPRTYIKHNLNPTELTGLSMDLAADERFAARSLARHGCK